MLIIAGLVMLGVGTVYPQLATVIYTTPTLTISPSFPSGTLATPTLLKGGALYTLEAYLTVLDVGSLTVKQVTISGTGYSQVVPLTWRHTVNYDKIDSVWTAPVLPDGILLTFVWHVESNVAGTVYKADATSYGKSGGPVGKFYINGQEANIDSTFTVSSPTLTLSFKCTQNGDLINGGVWIGIKCESPVLDTQVTLTETTADTEWTGTFTLPARGTYTLLGYISYGGNSYRLMSLLSTFGVTSIPQVNALQVIGGIMVIAGVAVEVLRKRAEVSRKGRRLSK